MRRLPFTPALLLAALAFACSEAGPDEVASPTDDFAGTDLAIGVGPGCQEGDLCTGAGNVYSAIYRIGTGPSSSGELLQTFTAGHDGVLHGVALSVRSLRRFTLPALATPPELHVEIFTTSAANVPPTTAPIATGTFAITPGAFGSQGLAHVTIPATVVAGGTVYAVRLSADPLPEGATGSLLLGVGCFVDETYAPAGQAFRRTRRGSADWSAYKPAGSRQVALVASVNPWLEQTITFTQPSEANLGTGMLSLDLTASSGLPVATSSTTPSVCSAHAGVVTFFTTGTCTISATQDGNAEYLPAPEVQKSFEISVDAQVVTFPQPGDRLIGEGSTALFATASSGLTVSFASSTPAICTVTGATAHFVVPGACTLTATQPGNSQFAAAAPVERTFTIFQDPQSLSFTQPMDTLFGAGTQALVASASSGLAVNFASSTPAVCTVAGSTATFVALGTCTITATQVGNTQYEAAAPVERSFLVFKNAQAITFAQPGDVGRSAGSVALTVSASSGLALTLASTTPAVCTLSGTTVSLVNSGTCTITANQPGDAYFHPAAEVSRAFTVSTSGQTIAFPQPAAANVADAPFALSATASSGLTVSFASTTTSVCTVSGATLTPVAVGNCAITATQAGGSGFTAATPVARTFAVNGVVATGGSTTTDITDGGLNYRVHTFNGAANLVVTKGGSVEYLVVAGGGAGGSNSNHCGGGGAGGLRQGTVTVIAQTYPVAVGAAGAVTGGVGGNGGPSAFATVSTVGGGGGCASNYGTGVAGGSGGGGCALNGQGGNGVDGEGFKGGTGSSANLNGQDSGAGGGGGAGGFGSPQGATGPFSNSPGIGGQGVQSGITGTVKWYAAGGNGAGYYYSDPVNGIGGATAGVIYPSMAVQRASSTAGVANTGSGGGGGRNSFGTSGSAGGTGVVIVRYRIP